MRNSEEFNDTEKEILYLIANGYSSEEIGKKLFCCTKKIKCLVRVILNKLGANNRAQAVYLAYYKGLIK